MLSNWPKGTNIAYAVGVGLATCAVSYAWSSGKTFDVAISESNGTKYYDVTGPLFFAASNRFLKIMNPDEDPDRIEVRFGESTSLMDYSAMEALHKIALSYRAKGKVVVFKSLCPESQKLITKANHLLKAIEYSEEGQEEEESPEVEA
jgi:SulP family sulfate permease